MRFFLLIVIMFASGCLSSKITPAQQLSQSPDLISRTLANGFQYALLPNGSDELAIVLQINTGSLAENEDQQGYAHLIEHMGFQGTAHFSDTDIQQLYRNVGMQLGADINAFTHFDRTQFIITLDKENANIDTASPFINWLADIGSGQFNIDPDKLSIEKSVVLAEGISHKQNPKPHFYDIFSQHLLKETQQAKRMPIGTPETVRMATIDKLNEFIKQHYQLNNATLIISGNGAGQYKNLIEQLFNTPQTTMPPKPYEPVKLNTDNFFFSQNYAEEFSQLMLHHPKIDQTLISSKQAEFLSLLYQSVIYNRLRRAYADTSLLHTDISINSQWFYGNRNSNIQIKHNSQQHAATIAIISTELHRLIRFGVTTAEFKQLRENSVEKLTFEKPSSSLDTALILTNKLQQNLPYSGFDIDHKIVSDTLEQLNVDAFNKQLALWLAQTTNQWAFSGTDLSPPYLTKKIENATQIVVLPPTEQELPALPINNAQPGSIVDETKHPSANITQWTLSNGIKVIMQPRHSDTVAMLFVGPGGLNTTAKADYPAAIMAPAVYSRSGQSWIEDVDLEKLLIDNKIGLHAVMQAGFQGLELTVSPEKLPLAFALINSTMNSAKIKKSTFDVIKQNFIEEQQKADLQADNQYVRNLSRARLSNANDYLMPTAEEYRMVTIEQIEKLYHQKYQNAAGYVLAITGDFEPKELRSLLEQNIATLNTNSSDLNLVNAGLFVKPSSSPVTNDITNSQKAYLNYAFLTPAVQVSIKERFKLVLLSIALREQLFAQLREKLGLVYDVSVPVQYSDKTMAYHFLSIMAVSDPQKVDSVKKSIAGNIAKMRLNGISAVALEQAKVLFSKNFKASIKNDNSMTYILATNDLINLNYMDVVNFEQLLATIDIAEIDEAINQYLPVEGKQIGIFYQ